MGMGMRLRAFPAFVLMLVVLIVDMQVIMFHRFVGMGQHLTVILRPDAHGRDDGRDRDQAQHRKSTGQTVPTAKPAGQRIAQQPARM